MHGRVTITYPRNQTEARRIFAHLDSRWAEMLKQPDKRATSRQWLNIVADVNALYRKANEEVTSFQKEVEGLRTVYKKATLLEKPSAFAAMMGKTVKLNFHQWLLRATKDWMRRKKIPKKY